MVHRQTIRPFDFHQQTPTRRHSNQVQAFPLNRMAMLSQRHHASASNHTVNHHMGDLVHTRSNNVTSRKDHKEVATHNRKASTRTVAASMDPLLSA